jgi:hypothetical protein
MGVAVVQNFALIPLLSVVRPARFPVSEISSPSFVWLSRYPESVRALDFLCSHAGTLLTVGAPNLNLIHVQDVMNDVHGSLSS